MTDYFTAEQVYQSLKEENAALQKIYHEQQVELETLRAKLKTYEGLGGAADDVQLLRMGYAAARLEIESLNAQLAAQQPGTAYAALPESLMLAVDRWFADNTGLGGCSGKDVRELAELFYDVTHKGGRESVDDALAIVESFGPGIGGLNDTYARQILLAEEVKRLRASHGQAPAQPAPATQQAGEREKERIAFKDAHRHLELDEVPDAWGRPMFKHSHVETSWLGWIARAARAPADSVLEDAARYRLVRRGHPRRTIRHGPISPAR